MKNKIIPVILCFFFLLPIRTEAAAIPDAQYVVNQADILTDPETTDLNELAQMLSETYQIDVLIAAVDRLGGMSAEEYAVFLNSDAGWWNSDHAIVFLLAMEEREWYIATFGDAIYLFSDYDLDTLGEVAVRSFSKEDFYGGFASYLKVLPDYFLDASADRYAPIPDNGSSPALSSEGESVWSLLPVSLVAGIAAAAISLLVMRSSMNTKRRQHSAGDYLKPGSYHLLTHQDMFLYSNLSKTRRQENSGGSRSGGGSSIHRSSGGRSYGGRGGKF